MQHLKIDRAPKRKDRLPTINFPQLMLNFGGVVLSHQDLRRFPEQETIHWPCELTMPRTCSKHLSGRSSHGISRMTDHSMTTPLAVNKKQLGANKKSLTDRNSDDGNDLHLCGFNFCLIPCKDDPRMDACLVVA